MYKTKTQKLRALRSVQQKVAKLYLSRVISVTDANKIQVMIEKYKKKL